MYCTSKKRLHFKEDTPDQNHVSTVEKVVTCGLFVLLSDCPAIPSLDTDLPTSGGPGREETKAGMTFQI